MTLAVVPADPLRDAAVEHRGFVRARLRRLGVERSDLDDATQDVFEVLARRIGTYDPTRGSPRAYLSGIARRVAARYRRLPEDTSYEDVVQDSRGDPERAVARAQAWAVLERFLDRLDQDRWTVFVLSEIEELSGPEIAAELSINVNTVYARLRSARKDLAREMKREQARQRGPLGWLLGLFAVPQRGVVATVGLGVVILLALGVSGQMRGCASAVEDDVVSPRTAGGPAEAVPLRVPATANNGTKLEGANGRDTPGPSAAVSVGEPWHELSTSTRTTEDFELIRSGRYQTQGDRLVLELTYQADAPVEAFPSHLDLDGFEVVEGTAAWSVSLQPQRPETERVVLRAVDTDIARVSLLTGFRALETEHDLISGAVKLAFVFDGETLDACARGACPQVAALEDADLSGEMILARVRNECSEPLDLVLFAGPKDHDPPAAAPRHSLAPGHDLSVRVDSSTIVYKMDGSKAALVASVGDHTDVVFTGETCNIVSTRPKDP